MELRQLEYFMAVAEELHFGKAAARLQMTQPPLSQQIRQLEEEMGVTLFQRTNRRVELTPAGEAFLAEIRPAVRKLYEAVETAQRTERGQTGKLVVGFVGSATYDLLPVVVRMYRERYPDVDVALRELSTPAQVDAILRGDLDVGIVRPPVSNMQLQVEVVSRTHCIVVFPMNHPLAKAKSVSLHDLAQEPFVTVSRETWAGFYDEFMGLCHQVGFIPNIRQEATEFQTIIGLVGAGVGVAVVPASAENLHARDVVYQPLKGPAPSVEMAVAWRNEPLATVLDEFLEVVRTVTSVSNGNG